MATLGKDLKGGGKSKSGGKAKVALAKAKLSTMQDADMIRKLAEQSKRILMERFHEEQDTIRGFEVKVQSSWLQILRMATVSSLRAEVSTLAAQHERDCAVKDAALRTMFDDLMAAEEQHRVALHNHLRQMDRLIELQSSRIADLEGAFTDELKRMHADFSREMAHIQEQHVVERRELRSLIATITEAEEQKAAEAEHAHVTAREELRNRATDRIQELSRTLDDRIMELEAAFEQAHVNYLHATDAKTESFKALMLENSKSEKRIERRGEAVERAKAALVSLRNKMAANAREFEEKNAALALEKAEQQAHLNALKSRLEAFRSQGDTRLQKLSVGVRAAREKLDEQLSLASRILQTAERCRQLETDAEKVAPVPVPDVAAGPAEDSLLAGPGASVRAASALKALRADATGGALAGTAGAVWGSPGVVPMTRTSARVTGMPAGVLAMADRSVATIAGSGVTADREALGAGAEEAEAEEALLNNATMTAGGLVPAELTAARHGFRPLFDGRAATAAGGATAALGATAGTVAGGGRGPVALEHLFAGDPADPANADVVAAAQVESALIRDTITGGELDALELFWRRFNKVLLDKLALERRRADAAAENARLRAALQQCVEGVTVSDGTFLAPGGNPLLAINGRTGLTMHPAVAAAAAGRAAGGGGGGGGGMAGVAGLGGTSNKTDGPAMMRQYVTQTVGVAGGMR